MQGKLEAAGLPFTPLGWTGYSMIMLFICVMMAFVGSASFRAATLIGLLVFSFLTLSLVFITLRVASPWLRAALRFTTGTASVLMLGMHHWMKSLPWTFLVMAILSVASAAQEQRRRTY